jgi:hypothetical protein
MLQPVLLLHQSMITRAPVWSPNVKNLDKRHLVQNLLLLLTMVQMIQLVVNLVFFVFNEVHFLDFQIKSDEMVQ